MTSTHTFYAETRRRLAAATAVVLAVVPLIAVAEGSAAAATATTTVVVPNALATAEGNLDNVYPFSTCDMRYQQVYAGAEVGSGSITAVSFRPDAVFGVAFSSTFSHAVITLSTTTKAVGGLSTTFADNVGSDVTTVVNRSLTLSSANSGPAGGPKDFDVVITLDHPFTFNAAAGNLLLDVSLTGCPSANATQALDATNEYTGSVSREASFEAGSATADVPGQSIGLVTQFTKNPTDTTPPMLTLPPNQNVVAGSMSGTVVNYPAPTASDNVDGAITPTCDPPSGSTFAIGTTTVTCTATDAAGNSSHGSFTVTVTYGPCDRTLTGAQPSLTLTSSTTCLIGATVSGGISVGAGAILKVENSHVNGSITAQKPASLRVCGSTTGSITVSGATGRVVVGDPTNGCAVNVINGGLSAVHNTGGGSITGNKITGNWIIADNTPPFTATGNHH